MKSLNAGGRCFRRHIYTTNKIINNILVFQYIIIQTPTLRFVMASTRNKNTRTDFKIEQNSQNLARNYVAFENSYAGKAYAPALAYESVGILPTKMSREHFARNSVDIESALFGINSTNLVEPQAAVVPQLKQLPEVKFFDRMAMFMPEPLVVEKAARPFQHAEAKLF